MRATSLPPDAARAHAGRHRSVAPGALHARWWWIPRAFVVLAALAACGRPEAPAPSFVVPGWARVAPEQLAEAGRHGVPVAFENRWGMRFVLVPSGSFPMGSPAEETGRFADEVLRTVTIRRPFYLQITELTNREADVLAPEPYDWRWSSRPTPVDEADLPATTAWKNAARFAERLSEEDPDRTYRLPTEAEWERACRAGGDGPWGGGLEADDLERVAWIEAVSPRPVGTKEPNRWGLHDLHGNVYEWCADVYPGGLDPAWPDGWRVSRGGQAGSLPCGVRCAFRHERGPDGAGRHVGFRLVSPLPESTP